MRRRKTHTSIFIGIGVFVFVFILVLYAFLIRGTTKGLFPLAVYNNSSNETTLHGYQTIRYVENITDAQALAASPADILFIASPATHTVYAARDFNHDGIVDRVFNIPSGLRYPSKVAYANGSLYIANASNITVVKQIDSHTGLPPIPRAVVVDSDVQTMLDQSQRVHSATESTTIMLVGAQLMVNNTTAAQFSSDAKISVALLTKAGSIFVADTNTNTIYLVRKNS